MRTSGTNVLTSMCENTKKPPSPGTINCANSYRFPADGKKDQRSFEGPVKDNGIYIISNRLALGTGMIERHCLFEDRPETVYTPTESAEATASYLCNAKREKWFFSGGDQLSDAFHNPCKVGVRRNNDKIDSKVTIPYRTDGGFFVLSRVIRRFLPNVSRIAARLNESLRNDQPNSFFQASKKQKM